MKTPRFWQSDGLVPMLLTPFAWIYGAATQWRLKLKKTHKCKAKVICIGNITAGGVGKTPVAMAMAEKYLKEGKKVFFVTRGYKGKLKNILVDLEKHTPEETGDEARLLAGIAPTIIAPQRELGAEKAVRLGAEIIIMDDGFQNPGLYKDESWLVFDGTVGIGNGKIIPAGPLRETLENGQKRADYILIMGEDKTGLTEKCQLPVYHGKLKPLPFSLENQRVLAFAGIGHPEKFYQTLKNMGYQTVITKDFPDHYAYKKDDLVALNTEASEAGLSLVTTEKDYEKLSQSAQRNISCLKVRAEWSAASSKK